MTVKSGRKNVSGATFGMFHNASWLRQTLLRLPDIEFLALSFFGQILISPTLAICLF